MNDFLIRYFSDPAGFVNSLFGDGRQAGDWGFIGTGWAVIRAIFLILDIILVAAFIVVYIIALQYRPKLHPAHGVTKKTFTLKDAVFKDRWLKIQAKFSQGTPDAHKLAIIDADKIADDALKRLGFTGDHMADRLEKIMPHELSSLDRLWQAHRLRNNLVHTPGYEVPQHDAKIAMGSYEAFLREIKVIQ